MTKMKIPENINKVIIWGYPDQSHTHHYIHYGWHKGFKHLGYDTYWFHDEAYPSDFDYSNSLFITEGYVDKNIPLDATSIYFVHVCISPEKYIGRVKRLIDMRYLVDNIKDCNYNYVLDKSRCKKISDCTYHEKLDNNSGVSSKHDNPDVMDYECIYTCWATDLLPEEILDSRIFTPREREIYWFGSANPGNNQQVREFAEECEKNGIAFISNDPWVNPKDFQTVMDMTAKSYMSPDIRTAGDPNKIALGETGTCHKKIGYIACRLLKAISYGQLGITNSKHMYDLLESKVIYNDDEKQLFYDARSHIENYDLIREQMEIVRKNHTWLNRIDDLLNSLSY
jgi:hypothetical protein